MTLERIEHKVFASEAPLDEMGQFGSALATTKLNTKDVAEIQALPAYTKGWGSAIISENNYPAMEEMNGVLNVMSYHTGYLYQEGIPIYSATQEYSATSWVKDLAGEKVYKSLQGGNKGHDLTDSAWWEELKLGGGGLEIGDIGIAPLGIDETKGKRRYLNGQLIIQEQYVQFANKVKSAVALYPSLACTESEWQTTATMSAFGQCGKFVIDDEAGTIRLPKITGFIQGLTDLSSLAEIVKAGLPTHTHTRGSMNITGNIYGLEQGSADGAFTSSDWKLLANDGADQQLRKAAFNASKTWTGSTSTGNYSTALATTNTVQPESVRYPYFIQVATGAETEDNIINEIELNNPFSLLDYKYSEYELNNLSWLRSNGQYNSKITYPAVYDLLLKIYNGTETKAGVSVKLSTEEYTDYDFVLNTAEETFRLPIYDGSESLPGDRYDILELKASGSDYIAPANGWFQLFGNCAQNGYASLTNNSSGLQEHDDSKIANSNIALTLPVSNGDSVTLNYGKITLTQIRFVYAKGNGSLYFYVGETVQNANLINAGRIEEKIAGIVPDNSSLISSYGLPGTKLVSLSAGASGATYIAPANGYFEFGGKASSASVSYLNAYIVETSLQVQSWIPPNVQGNTTRAFLPCKKGQRLNLSYYSMTLDVLFFRYAEGEQ